jgi:hypothetical protein
MAENEPVLVAVVVEPKFAVMAIDLDEFFPVCVLHGFVVLHQFEHVRESAAHF